MKILLIRFNMMPYTERFDDFEILTLRFTILRNCPTACTTVKAQTSLAPLSWFHGSRVTTAHAHQCCIFQSYAKTVPSRMKLTMKLTMREPASMTTDTWSQRVTSDFNSVYTHIHTQMQWWIQTICFYTYQNGKSHTHTQIKTLGVGVNYNLNHINNAKLGSML